MQKERVAVLFGGASSEYEVSLLSAASVIDNLPADRFEPVLVGITRDGRWMLYEGDTAAIADGSWLKHDSCVPALISPDRAIHGLLVLPPDALPYTLPLDLVFPVLHGRCGEDGTMQGLLELAGIPYVGCGVLASAVCMDKAVTNTLLQHFGIAHAPWAQMHRRELSALEDHIDEWERTLGYPMFVKPANAGSSVGISKASNRAALRRAVDLAFLHDDKILVEQNVAGRELECSVLGAGEPIASQVGEILPSNDFYDYDAKYLSPSKTQVPADIPAQLQAEIQHIAVEAFVRLGCTGMARVDFLVESATGNIYLNELNTIPGFTAISMYSKMLAASGIPYPELLGRLMDLSLEGAR